MAADSGEFREFPVPEEPEIDLLGHRESEDPDLWRPVRGAASDFLVFIIEKMRWPIVVALSITVVAIILILFSIPILLLLNVFNWPWGAIISPDQQQNGRADRY